MSMLSHFRLAQQAHVRTIQTKDVRGLVTWSPPIALPCFYEPSIRLIRTADGDQVASSGVLYFAYAGLTPDCLFFVPGADPGDLAAGSEALTVQDFSMPFGSKYSHTVVYLG